LTGSWITPLSLFQQDAVEFRAKGAWVFHTGYGGEHATLLTPDGRVLLLREDGICGTPQVGIEAHYRSLIAFLTSGSDWDVWLGQQPLGPPGCDAADSDSLPHTWSAP
jgi:hypothetical protein